MKQGQPSLEYLRALTKDIDLKKEGIKYRHDFSIQGYRFQVKVRCLFGEAYRVINYTGRRVGINFLIVRMEPYE